MSGNLVMFDSIDPMMLPAGAGYCYAGYVSGRWPDLNAIRTRFPHSRVLSIAIDAAHDADCLDIETGDATPADAARWYERQRARGVIRPALYASASVMQANVVPVIQAAGIVRSRVRLWSAHYAGKHICGPGSCGEMSIGADGTQWTSRALDRDLDESLLRPDFFGAAPTPPVNWQEAMMRELPVLKQGDSGEAVRTVQGLCAARGPQIAIDGQFGPATTSAVRLLQRRAGIAQDGVVGPASWPVLMGV